MGQEIQKTGKIVVEEEKEVVFTSRLIKEIIVEEGQNIFVRYINKAVEGEQEQTVSIPFANFTSTIETSLWSMIDKFNED